MMRSLWHRLTSWLHRPKPAPPAVDYDPDQDPAIRAIRLQGKRAERATRHLERRLRNTGNPIADTMRGTRRHGGRP